jgi:hypothetical protein
MRYRFGTIDFWEELKAVVGDIPCNVTDTGNEILFDFGDNSLTPTQEAALIKLMGEKPMIRGKLAKFIEKGIDIHCAS